MRTRTRLKRGLVLAGLAGLLTAALWPQLRLELREPNGGPALISLPLKAGEGFALRYLHSYDRTPCEEHFTLEGPGRVVLRRMVLRSALNGQGFAAGRYRPLPGGGAEVTDIDQALPGASFSMGSPDLADHRLLAGGRELCLRQWADPGTLLALDGAWRPWWW